MASVMISVIASSAARAQKDFNAVFLMQKLVRQNRLWQWTTPRSNAVAIGLAGKDVIDFNMAIVVVVIGVGMIMSLFLAIASSARSVI
jgi:hypothetical protein